MQLVVRSVQTWSAVCLSALGRAEGLAGVSTSLKAIGTSKLNMQSYLHEALNEAAVLLNLAHSLASSAGFGGV